MDTHEDIDAQGQESAVSEVDSLCNLTSTVHPPSGTTVDNVQGQFSGTHGAWRLCEAEVSPEEITELTADAYYKRERAVKT